MNDDTKDGLLIYSSTITNSINTLQVLGNILEEMSEKSKLSRQKQLSVTKILNEYIETTKRQFNKLQEFIAKQ